MRREADPRPAPVELLPTHRHKLVIEIAGQRLQQTLRFVDSATPTRKAKPAGVLGAEIWNKIGTTPPTGEGDLRFVAVDTNAPFIMSFDAADGGKTNYVWMRWVSPTGERGPWSEQAQATIAA